MATIYAMILGEPRNTTPGTQGYRPEGYWIDVYPEEYGDRCLWGPTAMQSVLILKVTNFPFEVSEIRDHCRTRNADDGTLHHRFVTNITVFRGDDPDNAKVNRQLSKGVKTRVPEDMVTVDWPTRLELHTTDNGGPRTVEVLDVFGRSFAPPVFEQAPPAAV